MGNNTPEGMIENCELYIMEMTDNGGQRQLGLMDNGKWHTLENDKLRNTRQWETRNQGNGGKWSSLQVGVSLVLMQMNKGYELYTFYRKCGTAWMNYHHLKTVINPIGFTINTHCHRKIEMIHKSFVYTFIHILVS